jgi:protease-4
MSTDGSSANVPTPIIVQERPSMFGRFGKWLAIALVLAIVAIVSLYGRYQSYFSPPNVPQERYHSLSRNAGKKIAVIDASGTIFNAEDSFLKQQIDRVREDDNVVAVVLRINSPGGTVTGSDYLYHHLRNLVTERKLPLVVSMGSVCASGGYYIAMAAGDQPDVLFAEPTTWTGSIGVIIPHYDFSPALTLLHVRDDSIASGQFKQMGSPTKPMSPEEREILKAMVDDSFRRFKEIITSGRPKFKDDPAALDAVATGQIFTANQALEKGLIDRIGFVEAAIARAAELAGIDIGNVRAVKYEQSPSLLRALARAEADSPTGDGFDLSALLDLATPRAYYLWNWLPSITSTAR